MNSRKLRRLFLLVTAAALDFGLGAVAVHYAHDQFTTSVHLIFSKDQIVYVIGRPVQTYNGGWFDYVSLPFTSHVIRYRDDEGIQREVER